MLWAKLYTGSGLLVVVRSTHRDNGGKVQSRLCRFLVVHGNYAERQTVRCIELQDLAQPLCGHKRGRNERERELPLRERERQFMCSGVVVRCPSPNTTRLGPGSYCSSPGEGGRARKRPPDGQQGGPLRGTATPLCGVCWGREETEHGEEDLGLRHGVR